MSHQKILFAFVCALLCFSLEVAHACSPYPNLPRAEVMCMDGQRDSVYAPYISSTGNDTQPYNIRSREITDLALSLCATDLSAGQAQIADLLDKYLATYSKEYRGIFELTPYTPERVREMELENLNLLTCRAYRYEVVEYWLVSYSYLPDYCLQERLYFSICGSPPYHVDLPRFLWYLVSAPTLVNNLYLVGMGAIVFTVGRWWRQQRLVPMLTATPLAIVMFLVACPALLIATTIANFSLDIGTLGWVSMVWVLAKGVNYVALKVWRVWRKIETPVNNE